MLERPQLRRERARRRLEQAPADRGDRRRSARRTCAARARASCGRVFISSATRERSSTPSDSPIWKAMPRATPSRPSPISSSSSEPSIFLTCWASQRSSRLCTISSCGAGQMLVGDQPHAGLEDVVARRDLARPARRASGSCRHWRGRRLRRPPRARGAPAPRSRSPALFARRRSRSRASSPSACGSGVKQNPCREPT